MNKTAQRNRSLVLAGVLSTLGMLAAACGTDPNGTPATTGGTGGKSGTTGGGGSAALPSLGAIVGTPLQTFDTDSAGFILSQYADPTEMNLAVTAPTGTAVSWDSTEGSPTPGSLKVTAAFTDWNQWVEVQTAMLKPLLDFTGKKLHVRMKVASGFGTDMYALCGAQAIVDTTSAYVQINNYTMVQLGTGWQEFVVDASTGTAGGFDPKMVITYGLHITSGQGNATAAKPTPAVFYVDSFSLE
jgi:hypothetical protein